MSKRALLAAAGALCVLSIGGLAYAAIPGSASGVINACYGANNGQLRVIDTGAGQTCRSNEVALSWDQNGQRGATGPTGPRGATGARGATGQAGAPGQKGATGSAGPKGATGAAGANGVSGYQLVNSGVTTLPGGGATASGSALCPSGKKVVGGGWDTDASKDVFVVSSTPNASGSAWLGTIQNNSTGSVQVVLTAACVTATP